LLYQLNVFKGERDIVTRWKQTPDVNLSMNLSISAGKKILPEKCKYHTSSAAYLHDHQPAHTCGSSRYKVELYIR
jgi:hypothetical protein